MDNRGLAIVYGSLILFVGLLSFGIYYHNNWVLCGGVLGMIVWFIGLYEICIAMNSDI